METQEIATKSGVLHVEKRLIDGGVQVCFRMDKCQNCLLHWGFRHDSEAPWEMPPPSVWPEGSRPVDQKAVQTPFSGRNGDGEIVMTLAQTLGYALMDFAIFYPEEDRWDNNDGRNYRIQIAGPSRPPVPPIEALKQEASGQNVTHERYYQLPGTGQLGVIVTRVEAVHHITLITDRAGGLILHWGVARHAPQEWLLPPSAIWPAKTTVFQDKAAETPFGGQGELRRLVLEIPELEGLVGISFVLRQEDTGEWLQDQGQNFYIPLAADPQQIERSFGSPLNSLAEGIIKNEIGRHSWTLMHRFNLCHDLLDSVEDQAEGLALIFIWLRFSAIRQLDWQRDYNTKPRELSHALDRLTLKLADMYGRHPEVRPITRLIMTTLGRGGEGQRIRDEILNIMHRHNIKEVSGLFLEEWHQKLHNNTTPDDVVICEAYLEFLKSDGNLDIFYETLEAGGVTRERLESYERPISSHPDFVPHLKEVLIHDSEHFLEILKSVHSGTDLGTAIREATYLFDEEMNELTDFIWANRGEGRALLCPLVEKITAARRWLGKRLNAYERGLRDYLFLDIALEDFMRLAVERNLHMKLSREQLVELIAMVLENFCLSEDHEELGISLRLWERLRQPRPFTTEWSLQAEAVCDRLERVLSEMIDHCYHLLQPKAEDLGRAFGAAPWVISLFSETVVRGRPVFVLAMLLRQINPMLRKAANLGPWQIISRGRGMGEVVAVDILKSIQGKRFDGPTIIVADKVVGDEQIPEKVTGIITPDTTDVVSHVAVRARNARLLFATCHEPEMIAQIKSLEGHRIRLTVSPGGDVRFEDGLDMNVDADTAPPVFVPIPPPAPPACVVSEAEFDTRSVGGKSNNLLRLRRKIPEWIELPTSVALPFGVFEWVLAQEINGEVATHYAELIRRLDEAGENGVAALLEGLRAGVLALNAPDDLVASLLSVVEEQGLGGPMDWRRAWECIKRVWASKWNERAYLSRRAAGIPHDQLFMSVIIQDVIEADYSFVIHTNNPLTGREDEIYAEVVSGLGETLVGNYPGKALSFTCEKGGREPLVRAFPSKRVGLFGSGLIFRSDSNGEDLAEYAGAGIYDSVLLEPAREVCLDYAHEPLMWNGDFRKALLVTIAAIGVAVEAAAGSPQDIEGVYAKGRYYVVQTRPQVGTPSA